MSLQLVILYASALYHGLVIFPWFCDSLRVLIVTHCIQVLQLRATLTDTSIYTSWIRLYLITSVCLVGRSHVTIVKLDVLDNFYVCRDKNRNIAIFAFYHRIINIAA